MDLKEAVGLAVDVAKTKHLECEMVHGCKEPVTHVDRKGYVYCTKHGERRRAGGISCRALRPSEVKKLERGETIRYR